MSDPLAGWDDIAADDDEAYFPQGLALACGICEPPHHIDKPGRPLSSD